MAKKSDSQQTYNQLMKEISEGKLLPVYFICGEEQFFTDRVQEALLSKIPPEAKDFNFDMLYGQDADISRILNVAKSYPMMAEKRFVLVREFFNSIKGSDGKENLSLLEPLMAYIKQPLESTVLILHDVKKPAKTTRFAKVFVDNKKAGFFEFDQIDGSQVPEWIISWTKAEFKKSISVDAAEVLYQITGSSLHQLSTELEKICTFKKTDEPISKDDVKSVVGFSRQYTVIELKEAVVSRDLSKSIHIAEQLLQTASSDTGEVIRTIAFLYTVFSKIWEFHRLSLKKTSRDQLEQHFGGSYRTKFVAGDAKNFHPNELAAIFEALLDADRAIKGFSKLDTEAIFIMMLRRIIA